MSFNQFSQNLTDNLCNSNGYNSDLKIVDYEILGETKAQLLFSYQKIPQRKNIINFIAANFDKKLMPDLGSFKIYKKLNAMSIEVNQVFQIRPINTKMNMRKITANAYLDTDNTNVWNIIEQDGKKFLQKNIAEDITSILKTRENIFTGNGLTFFRLTANVAGVIIEINDIISWKNNNKIFQGKVIKINPSNYIAQTLLGETWEITAKEVITHEKLKNPSLKEYLEKAYADNYGSLFFE